MSQVECEHPECNTDSCGVGIQGIEVCIKHIEWAMEKAFSVSMQAFDIKPTQKCPECGDRHQPTTPCYP